MEVTSRDGKNCSKRRLAQRGSFAVDACECGAVHLTIGYVTMRLERSACAEMADAIAEALDLLATQNRPPRLLS